MHGMMQDRPLTISMLWRRLDKCFGHKRVITGLLDGERELRWSNVSERARKLAGALDQLGVPAGARVATFGWNTHRHVELYLAVPCTGRTLHTVNHRSFRDQITFMVDSAGDDVVFVDRSLLPTVWPMAESLAKVRHFIVMDDGADNPIPADARVIDYEALLERSDAASTIPTVGDENSAATLCYTSGTTGNPKGVLYSHRSVVLHALMLLTSDVFGIREADVVMPIVPMFHVNAWGLPYATMLAGADLVLPGPGTEPPRIVSQLQRHKVTFAAAVAAVWRSLIPLIGDSDLSALRMTICGGGPLDPALAAAYENLAGVTLTNAWGMTETSPVVTVARTSSVHNDLDDSERRGLLATAGVAAPLTEIRIVGDDGVEIEWDGVTPGELQVAGPTIAAGYLDTQRGAESFSTDGWLRTGDVATIDPYGYVRIVDRTKDLIKSGGEWISSIELENAIMTHPRILEAAVIGRADARWGERPVVFVVSKDSQQVALQDLREHLISRVASWWVPDEVFVVDAIAKTATGKFAKYQLRNEYQAISAKTGRS
ncbi:long-chain fatty acid--CoA ligase [Mycobacterium paraffinicum]|uniref:Long-chain-fatty-acid--CoA ligase FadD13 n=1 Tax=Mycobacterium paraffinicum TaxID=53378 RepID=A0A1Q4H9L8_9MYCO|nr:long-chain fatty acid--CoA ligase [Mycobacterium paraffinicum]OJZ64112.1 long-chain fatty acid--CoA ligase [Mycobacterium paraffinicum]